MNINSSIKIQSTKKPSPAKTAADATKPSEANSAQAEPADNWEFSDVVQKTGENKYQISVPHIPKKRLISGGIGAAAGMGLGYFFGGGLGLIGSLAAGAAVGGTSGVAVTSETAGNLWDKAKGSYGDWQDSRAEAKRQQRLEAESATKAEALFDKKIEEVAQNKFEAKWATDGDKLVNAEVNTRVQKRIDEEVGGEVDRLFEERLQTAAETGLEKRWSKEGESLKEAEIERLLNERLEFDLGDEVEAEVDNRFEEKLESASQLEFEKLWKKDGESLKAAEVERLVQEELDAQVAHGVDESFDERYQEAVEDGLQKELTARESEINDEIKVKVQEYLDELSQEKIEELSEITAHSQSIEAHQTLGHGAEQMEVRIAHFTDGLELFSAAGDASPADVQLAQTALSTKMKDESVRHDYLDQVMTLLSHSTGEAPGSLEPTQYLNAISDHSEAAADVAFLSSGLEILAEHGALEPGQKKLCGNAVKQANKMEQELSKSEYLQGVFVALSGQ